MTIIPNCKITYKSNMIWLEQINTYMYKPHRQWVSE